MIRAAAVQVRGEAALDAHLVDWKSAIRNIVLRVGSVEKPVFVFGTQGASKLMME